MSIDTIKLPERMDSTTAAAAEQMLRAAMRPGARIIVDGSAVGYMSAAGVRALAGVLHGAEEISARVVFCRFTGPAVDCLEVSGFAQLLEVAESLEEASDRLNSTGGAGSNRLHQRRTAG
ncbi:MAG: STAS domain-containing protein [Reyranella sp.]|uniref:STAS domain-containing protein n=1 Tax=Reyranella sp. TaxID=1929291 RepID=UPI001AC8B46A|nr:STAS domain-containing protein [Reyranella sp.]MBN9089010.1 STAS domain-containing protein [Reyranella sp.]